MHWVSGTAYINGICPVVQIWFFLADELWCSFMDAFGMDTSVAEALCLRHGAISGLTRLLKIDPETRGC
jgi:hypothetical protein